MRYGRFLEHRLFVTSLCGDALSAINQRLARWTAFVVWALLPLLLLGLFAGLGRGVTQAEARRVAAGYQLPPTAPAWSDQLVDLDYRLARCFFERRRVSDAGRYFWAAVTQLGSPTVLTIMTLGLATLVWCQGQPRQALACLLVPALGGLLILGLKEHYDRPRPVCFKDPLVSEENQSFPSGHALGALVGYGLLAYLIVVGVLRVPFPRLCLAGLVALILAVGFSRVYLAAHFVSDVIAGYLLGASLLVGSVLVLEVRRRTA